MQKLLNITTRSQVITFTDGLIAVVLLGFADYFTGPDISFALFYLIPLSIVAWYAGRRSGLLLAVISVAVWMIADTALGTAYRNPLARYWNAAAKLGFFVVVVQLLVSFKSLYRHLGDLVKERTVLLEAEIAEHKRTELALRESEERFRRLAEHAEDMIYRYRLWPTRGFEYVSSAAAAITGCTPEELYADPDLGSRIVHPDDREQWQERFVHAHISRSPMIVRWVRKDGSIAWTEERDVPICNEAGQVIAVEGIARDITEQKRAQDERADLFQQVHAGRARLQSLTRQLIDTQENERRYIARELHDEIGQVLTAVKTNLQAIQLAFDPQTLGARLEESIQVVDRALGQIGDLSLDLRPSLLDDFGLAPALEWYARRQAERSGFAVTFVATPENMHLPPSLETTCFRVAQAALTNVARHAHAAHVRVELVEEPAELRLLVRDDGIGFDAPAALERTAHNENFGLLAMQERVGMVGGQIEFESAPGCGTQIRVRLPLQDPVLSVDPLHEGDTI